MDTLTPQQMIDIHLTFVEERKFQKITMTALVLYLQCFIVQLDLDCYVTEIFNMFYT